MQDPTDGPAQHNAEQPDEGAGPRDVAAPAKAYPTSIVVPLLIALSPFLVLAAAVGLYVLGPPVLNWLEVQVGLQSVPPPRPPSLPHAAQPTGVYANGRKATWKWVVCEEREPLRYACRIWGAQDRLEIVSIPVYAADAQRHTFVNDHVHC